MVWAAGQRLQNGKYIIEKILGQGGFGITYKALHTKLNQPVVIKTPNASLQNDPEYAKFVKRFIKEGQLLARLSEEPHPSIVRVSDLFEEYNIPCLVMDFIAGENFWELVQRRGTIPETEAVEYLRQIGEALVIVHQAGIVHRDAHPGNMMLRKNGKAVLIDFGIAGEIMPASPSSRHFANLAFAPWEQMSGSREPTVDVYSLAASLYYAVTGQRPTACLERKLQNIALVSPKKLVASISDELNEAILKGMELEAQNRPHSVREWLELLGNPNVATVWYPGSLLQGDKYAIERVLAQGGFGITYLARDKKGNRVVIKTLKDEVRKRPDFAKFQDDFVKEALRLAKCHHPHIVEIYDVFQEGARWCMAMEYIEGEHLADRVVNGGILSEAEALGYIRQIGEALTVVHQNGLLHRDVKPANIMLRAGKREAVLIDFGIAREFAPDLTQPHTPFLSHCFAPIEQYQENEKRGAYTDVYALAATLYFALTKRLPPPAPLRVSGTVLEPPKRINPSISDEVEQGILKGMVLEGRDRPQSIDEWLGLLALKNCNVSINSSLKIRSIPWVWLVCFFLISGLWGWFDGYFLRYLYEYKIFDILFFYNVLFFIIYGLHCDDPKFIKRFIDIVVGLLVFYSLVCLIQLFIDYKDFQKNFNLFRVVYFYVTILLTYSFGYKTRKEVETFFNEERTFLIMAVVYWMGLIWGWLVHLIFW
ncbi:serine/threonine protein kinase [Aerosakkonema funiforme]|uniref:serine/threonine protein kinase n=1 Tax=Aerosakkonema funiforme TaxID=1246630 RepID=UPI0035B9B43A